MTERPATPKLKSRAQAAAERPRVGGPRQIADLMPQIGAAAFRKFGFVQSSIVTRWAEIVGQHYAEISAPESIRFPVGKKAGGTLQLTVMSGHAPMIQHVLPDTHRSGEPLLWLCRRGEGRNEAGGGARFHARTTPAAA